MKLKIVDTGEEIERRLGAEDVALEAEAHARAERKVIEIIELTDEQEAKLSELENNF